MNLSPVARLKKTWSKVKTAKFDVLEVGTQACLCWREEGGPFTVLCRRPRPASHSAGWCWRVEPWDLAALGRRVPELSWAQLQSELASPKALGSS